MSLFGKTEYRKIELPFNYIKEEEDKEAGGISIEAYGKVDELEKYFYISFIMSDSIMYDNGDYEDMIQALENQQNGKITINAKYKKGKLVGFNIEKDSLVKTMKDNRFDNIDIIFSSISDKSRKK